MTAAALDCVGVLIGRVLQVQAILDPYVQIGQFVLMVQLTLVHQIVLIILDCPDLAHYITSFPHTYSLHTIVQPPEKGNLQKSVHPA